MAERTIPNTRDADGGYADGQDRDSDSGVAETKGERTRRRLLEVATERFGDRGYRGTSVSEIARTVGLTQAAVYAYFDGKEALFDAAVDADGSALLAEVRDQTGDPPTQQLVPLLLMHLIGGIDRHPLVRRVLGGNEPDALQRLVNLPALGELTRTIAERVKADQADGTVRTDLDGDLFASGAETLVLSLLMSITQVGASTETRRQLGVLTIFDAALSPPSP